MTINFNPTAFEYDRNGEPKICTVSTAHRHYWDMTDGHDEVETFIKTINEMVKRTLEAEYNTLKACYEFLLKQSAKNCKRVTIQR